MHQLLERIFETGQYVTSQNKAVAIHSHTSREQCDFLQGIIAENGFRNTIEIGLAYGTSSLAITEAVARNNGQHIAIDKFESSHWDNVGVELIERAGYADKFKAIEEYSHIALPRLLEKGERFDFAYIDTVKLLDHILVDFFFLDKMLEVGGVVCFDDVNYESIKKLLRYLSQFPHYKVYASFPLGAKPDSVKSLARVAVGKQTYSEYKRDKRDLEHGLYATCVALQKTGEDSRPWDWHKDF